MTGLELVFAAVGLLTAASAVLAVTVGRVLHAALWLVVALGGVAGCYLVLGAELVALVQLLVYVGGVVVLVLFALMLTRQGVAAVDTAGPQRVLAGLVALATTVLLGSVLVAALGAERVPLPGASGSQVASQVLGTWVWPFELLSLLLLAALVAAVAVATHRVPGAGQEAEEPAAEPGPPTDAGPVTSPVGEQR